MQNGFFDQPLVVVDEGDLERVLQLVGDTDWLEYVRQQKPNSKWRIALLTDEAFHLYPMEDKPIGRGKFADQLPKWLVRIEVWMRWKKTRTLASCMQTTRVIFDAWRDTGGVV